MNTKIIPFDLETAKKIQAGEIEGRIVSDAGHSVKILCFDMRSSTPVCVVLRLDNGEEILREFNTCGCNPRVSTSLLIELLEETPKREFKPFDKVLVRNISDEWRPNLYSRPCILADGTYEDGYMTIDDKRWRYCIPFDGNEHLVGTTNNPKEL